MTMRMTTADRLRGASRGGPRTFGGGQKRKATSASVGGASASKTSRAEGVPEEGATAGEMMFSIWNPLGPVYMEGG